MIYKYLLGCWRAAAVTVGIEFLKSCAIRTGTTADILKQIVIVAD